jgi:hypothetical protein
MSPYQWLLWPPGMLWASIELTKHMASGHVLDSLGQFFASLTVYDCSALSQAIYGSGYTALGCSTVRPVDDGQPAIQDHAPDCRVAEDSEFWDRVTGTASFHSTFDPISSRRRDVIANARHASIYGVHPEEFQARCASRELPFPFAEEDAVALLIYDAVGLQFGNEASCEHFLRLYVGGKGCGTALLVSARTSVAMDAIGRISGVRLFPQAARGSCISMRRLECSVAFCLRLKSAERKGKAHGHVMKGIDPNVGLHSSSSQPFAPRRGPTPKPNRLHPTSFP